MTVEETVKVALSLPDAYEDHPFGDTPHVYKVARRIFAFVVPDVKRPNISLKCQPEIADFLRHQYADVIPGYHLNKRHWNTVRLNGDVPEDEILEMIYHSYDMVIAKLPKAIREALRAEVDRLVAMEEPGGKPPSSAGGVEHLG